MRKALAVLVCSALLALVQAAAAEEAASWSVTPERYEFTPRGIGAGPSAPAVFTVTNTGTTALPAPRFSPERASDEYGDSFRRTNHCEAALAPGESCTFEVTFEATVLGIDTEFVELSQAPEEHISALHVQMTGRAAVPDLSFPIGTLPSRWLGNELNPPEVIAVANTGEADLHIYGLGLTELGTNPINPDGLRIVGGTCGVGVTLAVLATCTVQLTYTPTVAGYVNAGLEFTDNVPDRNSPLLVGHQVVPIRMYGIDPREPPTAEDVAITAGPPAQLRRTWARFRFVVPGAPSAFLCSLDAKPYRPCLSPTTYRHLALGRHVFRVRPAVESPTVSGLAATKRFRVLPPRPRHH